MWLLEEAKIENFKSIKSLNLRLERGFTVLTGPNGSGKSNVLEAILFGLGEVPQNLRAKSVKELAGTESSNKRIVVSLTFKSRLKYVTVGSMVVDGQRTYYNNGARVSKGMFEHTLCQVLGFAKQKSCYSINQKAAQKIINYSPKQLFSALCDVAGTHSLLQSRCEAEKEITQSEEALDSILRTVGDLERAVLRERDYDQVISVLEDAEKELDTCRAQLRVYQKIKGFVEWYAGMCRIAVLASQLSTMRSEINATEGELKHKENQLEEWQEGKALSNKRHAENRAELLKTNLKNIRSQMGQLTNAADKMEGEALVLEKQIEHYEVVLRTLVEREIPRAVKQLQREKAGGREKEHAKVLQRAEVELQVAVSHRDDLQTLLKDLRNKAYALQVSRDSLESRLLVLRSGGMGESLTDLRLQLDGMQMQLDLERDRVVKLRVDMGVMDKDPGVFGEDDMGCLCDLITTTKLRNHCEVGDAYWGALQTIMGSALGARVCRYRSSGLRIARECEKEMDTVSRGGVRIWPLDCMEVETIRGSAYLKALERGHGCVDPVQLLEVVSQVPEDSEAACLAMKAIYKACGRWMIVPDDDTATAVLQCGGVGGCITLEGNLHTPSSVLVGGKLVKSSLPPVCRLKEYQSSTHLVSQLSTKQDEVRLRLQEEEAREREIRAVNEELQNVDGKLQEVLQSIHDVLHGSGEDNGLEAIRVEVELLEAFVYNLRCNMIGDDGYLNGLQEKAAKLGAEKEIAISMCTELRESVVVDRERVLELEKEAKAVDLERLELVQHIENSDPRTTCEGDDQEQEDILEQIAQLSMVLDKDRNYASRVEMKLSDEMFHLIQPEDIEGGILQRDGIQACSMSEEWMKLQRQHIAERLGSILDMNWEESLTQDPEGCVVSLYDEISALQVRERQLCGKCAELKTLCSNNTKDRRDRVERRAEIMHKSAVLDTFRDKVDQIITGLEILKEGVVKAQSELDSRHLTYFSNLRQSFQQYFRDLVPGRYVDLVPASWTTESNVVYASDIEKGLKIVLKIRDGEGEERSAEELSGGQQVLLGLAFMFACALTTRSPIYLLDEVDAALDEGNQKAIAVSINSMFTYHSTPQTSLGATQQVVCISHNPIFQSQAATVISITMQGGHTVISG